MNKNDTKDQVKRLRRMGLALLAFGAALQISACTTKYLAHAEGDTCAFLANLDAVSLTMMALLFSVMALVCFGAAWQRSQSI